MGVRDHGYYGYAFVGARPAQIVALIAVIGMVGHFVSQDTHAHISAPGQLVGTLVMSCLALLWALLSFTAYDDTHFPYTVTSGLDLLFMVPFIVIAAVLGGPLSGVTCSALPAASASNAAELLAIQMSGGSGSGSGSTKPASYMIFVGNNQTTCFAIMAVWGLVIALCVLFALSGFATGLLFLGQRRATAAERAAERAAAAASASAAAAAGAPGGSWGQAPGGAFGRRGPLSSSESAIEMALAPGKMGFDDDEGSSLHSGVSWQHHGDARGGAAAGTGAGTGAGAGAGLGIGPVTAPPAAAPSSQ